MQVKGVYVGRYSDQTKMYTLCKDKNKKLKEDIDQVRFCVMRRLESN